jgi:hypothetical protein
MVRLDAPAEIAYLDDISIFDQYIFRLDISVDETLLMHIVYTTTNLDEEVKSRILCKELLLPNQVKQIALACVLKS